MSGGVNSACLYRRESAFRRRLCEAYGNQDIDAILATFAHQTFKSVRESLVQDLGISVSEYALRSLFRRAGVPLKKQSHQRHAQRGKHQQRIQRVFGLPFVEVVDALLLNLPLRGRGIFCSVRIRNQDPIDGLEKILYTIYPKSHDVSLVAYPTASEQTKKERRVMRFALFRAMGERSMQLGLSTHMDMRFPRSMLSRATFYAPEKEDTAVIKNYDIPDDVQEQEVDMAITLHAWQTLLVFKDGQALNIVARPHPNGGVQNTFEMLSRAKTRALLTREGDVVTMRSEQITKACNKMDS